MIMAPIKMSPDVKFMLASLDQSFKEKDGVFESCHSITQYNEVGRNILAVCSIIFKLLYGTLY